MGVCTPKRVFGTHGTINRSPDTNLIRTGRLVLYTVSLRFPPYWTYFCLKCSFLRSETFCF